MRLLDLLFEGREQFIAQSMGHKLVAAFQSDPGRKPAGEITPEQIVQQLAAVGPKNLQWVAKQYTNGAFRWEDLPQVNNDLKQFAQLVKGNAIQNKDLNSYKTLKDLRDVLSSKSSAGEEYHGKMEKLYQGLDQSVAEGHGKWVYNTQSDPIKIYTPTDEQGSVCIRRTYPDIKWCTTFEDNMEDVYIRIAHDIAEDEKEQWEAEAEGYRDSHLYRPDFERRFDSILQDVIDGEYDDEIDWSRYKDNMHDHYMKKHGGEFYVILTPEGPYQIHFESDQFKDEKDEDIDYKTFFKKYPSVAKVLGSVVAPKGYGHYTKGKKGSVSDWVNIGINRINYIKPKRRDTYDMNEVLRDLNNAMPEEIRLQVFKQLHDKFPEILLQRFPREIALELVK